jgi:hypothetical protein
VQLEGPRGGHLLAGGEPGFDQHLVAQHGAALDLAQVCARPAHGVDGDHEDVIASRTPAQRAHGHGDGRLRGCDRHAHAHRCTRRRSARDTLDPRAHQGVPSRRIDARVGRDDRGFDRRSAAGSHHLHVIALA